MESDLLATVRRHADLHADRHGIARTAVPGLTLIRQLKPTALQYDVSTPLVALVLQGRKRVTFGACTIAFGAGESLLITTDVPTVSQITQANAAAPYYSLVINLDPPLIAELAMELQDAGIAGPDGPMRVCQTERNLAETARRIVNLLENPAYVPLLERPLRRELHLWLLAGRHGGAVRALGMADSHARRIGRAVAIIRADYRRVLRMEQLAEAASMSLSSFHEHFRTITALTPLQFQKQLRLIEARRRLLAEGPTIAQAAYDVGYESVPQFTRDYGRMFGQPPARDMRAAKAELRAVA